MDTETSSTRGFADADGIALLRDRPGVWLTFAGSAFLRLYAERLRDLGLKPNWVVALAIIHERPGTTQSGLGRALGMNRASSMALSIHLESAGFLNRIPMSGRRKTSLSLTGSGQRSLLAACEIERRLCEALLRDLDDNALAGLTTSLRRITARVAEAMAGEPASG